MGVQITLLDAARTALRRTEIGAPIGGSVSGIDITVGEVGVREHADQPPAPRASMHLGTALRGLQQQRQAE